MKNDENFMVLSFFVVVVLMFIGGFLLGDNSKEWEVKSDCMKMGILELDGKYFHCELEPITKP